jgi:hypothetical protein
MNSPDLYRLCENKILELFGISLTLGWMNKNQLNFQVEYIFFVHGN